MNNKGFVFIETIVTIVVLTTTLILLYSSYSMVISSEKKQLYNDDIAYVYKTLMIKDLLKETIDISKFQNLAFAEDNSNININNSYLFAFHIDSNIYKDKQPLTEVYNTFLNNKLKYLIFIKIDQIQTIKNCINGIIDENDEHANSKCQSLNNFIDKQLKEYLLAFDVPKEKKDPPDHTYILISAIYESKVGNDPILEGNYDACMQRKIFEELDRNDCVVKNSSDAEYKTLSDAEYKICQSYITDYYKGKLKDKDGNSIYYNMHCETAYYISWVYV